jgi:uncharacterized membrane protein
MALLFTELGPACGEPTRYDVSRSMIGTRSYSARLLASRRVSLTPRWMLGAICRHWLWLANAFLISFALLPIVAPICAALGADRISEIIFQLYAITCHQMPSRSYFLFGYQMAYCERNTAIYAAMAASGIAYSWLRRQDLSSLSLGWYALLILPMAVDGFGQLLGYWESTWLIRGLTGSLFGVATAWLTLPRLQESFAEILTEL